MAYEFSGKVVRNSDGDPQTFSLSRQDIRYLAGQMGYTGQPRHAAGFLAGARDESGKLKPLIGTAPQVEHAQRLNELLEPHLVSLGLNEPGMQGFTFMDIEKRLENLDPEAFQSLAEYNNSRDPEEFLNMGDALAALWTAGVGGMAVAGAGGFGGLGGASGEAGAGLGAEGLAAEAGLGAEGAIGGELGGLTGGDVAGGFTGGGSGGSVAGVDGALTGGAAGGTTAGGVGGVLSGTGGVAAGLGGVGTLVDAAGNVIDVGGTGGDSGLGNGTGGLGGDGGLGGNDTLTGGGSGGDVTGGNDTLSGGGSGGDVTGGTGGGVTGPTFEWPDMPDWLKNIPASVWGAGLEGLLGYFGADAKGDALKDIQDRFLNEGQWARDRYQQTFTDPNYFTNAYKPQFDLMGDIAARSAGVRGNPGTTPSLQGEIMDRVWTGGMIPLMNSERSSLNSFGWGGTNVGGQAGIAGADFANPWLQGIGTAAGSIFGNQKPNELKLTIGGNQQ